MFALMHCLFAWLQCLRAAAQIAGLCCRVLDFVCPTGVRREAAEPVA